MDRRQFNSLSVATGTVMALLALGRAHALTLDDLSQTDASKGLKLALEKSAGAAIQSLGAASGFLGNDKVRIPLPPFLEDAARLLRTLGQGAPLDDLVTAMNRAAEAAIPQAKPLLVKAVQGMTVSDAKDILAGGETGVTQFFASKTRSELAVKFLPIVVRATEKTGLAAQYNDIAGKAAGMGLLKKEDANIQQYVTGKALDGLYFMISEEEKKIRQNPAAYGSALLSKVFGALR